MTLEINVLGPKPNDLTLIPRSHMVDSREVIITSYSLNNTHMQKVYKCNFKLNSKQITRIYYNMKIYLASHADNKDISKHLSVRNQ